MYQQDDKVLEELRLDTLPDNEKKAVLAMIDQRLEKRFLANLLMSLDDDKRQMLESKIGEIEEPKIDDVVRIALDIQPDAPKILADSANEVMTELKGERQDDSGFKIPNFAHPSPKAKEWHSEATLGKQDSSKEQPTSQEETPNAQPATAEELPPVGADVPVSANDNVPPENNPSPNTSHPTPNSQPSYDLDDTLRQGANKSGDYYQP